MNVGNIGDVSNIFTGDKGKKSEDLDKKGKIDEQDNNDNKVDRSQNVLPQLVKKSVTLNNRFVKVLFKKIANWSYTKRY